MALILTSTTGTVALGSDAATNERGFLVKMINRTGHASVKGEVCAVSTATDREVILCANGFDAMCVVQEAGVAEGAEMWCWTLGSVAQVLFYDGTATTRGYIALAYEAVDGRAEQIAVPSGTPGNPEHWREIGHIMESKSSGTNVMALVSLHFN